MVEFRRWRDDKFAAMARAEARSGSRTRKNEDCSAIERRGVARNEC
jgi:hypothetical protein